MPLVSVIVATTPARRQFLERCASYFERQTFQDAEFVVVYDDVPLGAKLNLGVERSLGQIIQKWDDDDYYAPNFLQTSFQTLKWRKNCISAWTEFLVLLDGQLRVGTWRAGGTLAFYRELWEAGPFRNVPAQVDSFFFRDHPNANTLFPRGAVEQYMLVRHDGNTWTFQDGFPSADAMIRRGALYPKTLDQVLTGPDLEFYRGL
jgi:glycosyltransferase involved in cell wall biosynthesis